MVEIFDFNFSLTLLGYVYLKSNMFWVYAIFGLSRDAFTENPIIKGVIPTMVFVSFFGILVCFFNSYIKNKVVDQKKMKRLMTETNKWKKERIDAMKSKDYGRIMELNKKSSYINKISFEIMQMNMKPMIFTFAPLILIVYFVLPELFANTVALSPISLNIFPGNFFHITCTAEQVINLSNICSQENSVFRWSWYFLSTMAFSGIIMKITKTTMGLD